MLLIAAWALLVTGVMGASAGAQDDPLANPSPGRLSPDTRLSPRPPAPLFTQEKTTGTGQLVGYFVALVALAGVGLFFMKRGWRIQGTRGGESQLHLLETKMLGNRQFLVVVKYQDNKMLLGVGPGQIQYLCSLDSADADMEELIRESQQRPSGPELL